MLELDYHFSLTPDWQYLLAKKIGAKLIDEEIMILPENYGQGQSYFAQVIPGISVLLLDAVFSTEITLSRLNSSQDLYILQFDVSEEINEVVFYNEDSEAPEVINSGFSVMKGKTKNYYNPVVGQRTFALRLFIDKDLLSKYLTKRSAESDGFDIKLFDKDILAYNYIDSKSKLLIHALKGKSVFDVDFNFYIKGMTLRLLSNFIDSFTVLDLNKISKIDAEAITKTKEYLLNNLYAQFPSLSILADKAGMSVSKYKLLFKSINKTSPNQFFIKEKMIEANKLLLSGEFFTVAEVAERLDYSNNQYFSAQYFKYFEKKPSDNFIKKVNL